MTTARKPCHGCNGPQRSDLTIVADPLYHGPQGHAPGNLCFDCWTAAWTEAESRMASGGQWQACLYTAFLVAAGHTRTEAAEMAGIHRNTFYRWRLKIQAYPQLIPLDLRRKAATLQRLGLAAMK